MQVLVVLPTKEANAEHAQDEVHLPMVDMGAPEEEDSVEGQVGENPDSYFDDAPPVEQVHAHLKYVHPTYVLTNGHLILILRAAQEQCCVTARRNRREHV